MKFEMAADIREHAGKGVARQLRRKGKIPAVLYGQGECLLLTLDPDAVKRIVRSHAASTALISLSIAGGQTNGSRTALFRDYQLDPVTGEILHADLFEVSMTKAIRVKVPVNLVGGTPAGVKEGGVLHHNLRELHIECLPSAIPDAIDLDASQLQIGHGIHVSELKQEQGIRFLDEADLMVVSVAAPMSEARLEALLTSGAAVEEGKEPEVVAKGKVEGEAAPGAAGDAKAEKKEGAKEQPKAEKKEAKEEKKK
ncbi:MAG TPA: 50S ribosomal protein L25 [Nitrospiraceae bacterium]|nr:50S ribosomal protein L25 [Nitrospiraceae bacterium]